MADPVVSIEPSHVSVQPGGQARVVVTIANPGSIVDGYRVDVVDEVSGNGPVSGPAHWGQVLLAEGPEQTGRPDASISVYPRQRAQVVVVFSPGSGPDVPGGTFAYGVRVVSVVDPSATAVVEGEVEIGRVFGLQAKLVPVSSTGRWSGNHVVQISNWGNAPARLRLAPTDPDQALGYLVRPEVVDVPLGGSVSARVRVRTRRPRLRGQVSRLPFSIVGEPDPPVLRPGQVSSAPDPGRPVVDGAFSQKPILSRAVVTTTALTLMAALAVGGIAFAQRPEGPTVAQYGVPDTPVLTPAVAVSPTQIKLAWAPVANVSGYELDHISEGANAVEQVEPLDKAVGAHQVKDLEPGKQYCFQLRSLRGEASSPPSPKTCATTKPAPATPTTTPLTSGAVTDTTTTPTTGSTTPTTGRTVDVFAPTDYIEMVYVLPNEAPGSEATIRGWLAALVSEKVDAKLLRTSDYPKLRPPFVKDSWVVYLGTFTSREQATAACANVQKPAAPPVCLAAQPAP